MEKMLVSEEKNGENGEHGENDENDENGENLGETDASMAGERTGL